MIINNGIISKGNNNTNIINDLDYDKLIKELNVLLKYTNEKDKVTVLIDSVKEKDNVKFKSALKKLGSFSLELIKELSLTVLSKYIETLL